MTEEETEFLHLIPLLKDWGDWEGMTPADWIGAEGTYEQAIGYSFIFWPRFKAVEGYILHADAYKPENLRAWEAATDRNRRSIEAVINHVHLADVHPNADPDEAQLRYFGRILRQTLEAKLARDFPDREFEVVFNDEPGLDLIAYEITFWQRDEKSS